MTVFASSSNQNGYLDGSAMSSAFNIPYSISMNSVGDLYVVELANCGIRKLSSSGTLIQGI